MIRRGPYRYRSRRDGDRTRLEYLGRAGGPLAVLAELVEAQEREARLLGAEARRAECEAYRRQAADVAALAWGARRAADVLLVAAGCRRHNRQWLPRGHDVSDTSTNTPPSARRDLPEGRITNGEQARRCVQVARAGGPHARQALQMLKAMESFKGGLEVVLDWVFGGVVPARLRRFLAMLAAGADPVAREGAARHSQALVDGLAEPGDTPFHRLIVESFVASYYHWAASLVRAAEVSQGREALALAKRAELAHRQLVRSAALLGRVRRLLGGVSQLNVATNGATINASQEVARGRGRKRRGR